LKYFVEYAQAFLNFKLFKADKSKIKDDFNITVLKENLISKDIKTIEEVHAQCNIIATKGLKQLQPPSNALKNFHKYMKKNKNTLDDVDTQYIDDYINVFCSNENLGIGTRNNYRKNIIAFCTFIDNTYKLDNKFNIKSFKVTSNDSQGSKKPSLEDWIDTPTIVKVNQEILEYDFKNNEFEKARDILIFRLFCFSGITPSEMASLTLDSFAFEDKIMYLNIKGARAKKRTIPLPKRKLIVYYNQYLNLRESKADTFFYSPSSDGFNSKIDTQYLNTVVKRLLVFTEVIVKDKTPSMLRKSWMILLNNEKDPITGFTQPLKNIQYLAGIELLQQVKDILKYSTIDVITATNVFDNLDI
jgi:integrase